MGLGSLFQPKSIVVLGATADKGKLNYTLVKNIIFEGYAGKLCLVSSKYKRIFKVKTYRSILDIGGPIDLALLGIPARAVPDAVRECARKRVKNIVVLSSGFGEASEEGRKSEENIMRVARRHGMRVVGPNCMGIYNRDWNLNATYFWELDNSGSGGIGFISQSGAYGGILFEELRGEEGVGVSKFISIGNACDVEFSDVLDSFASDRKIKVILMYMEGLRNGRRFIEAAKKASRVKPVIVCKSGRTHMGARATASHTGALTAGRKIYECAFRQAGLVSARDVHEMLDSARALIMQPLPKSWNAAIITISGGPSVSASDAAEEAGIILPRMGEKTGQKLKKLLAPVAVPSNPLDMTPQTPKENYQAIVSAIMSDKEIGGVLAINVGLDHREFADAFAKCRRFGKPVLAFTSATPKIDAVFRQSGIPIFRTPERAVRAYRALAEYGWMKSSRLR